MPPPIALLFALKVPLDQIITFSILSGLLEYTFMPLNVILFRKKWPLASIKDYVEAFKKAIPEKHWEKVFRTNAEEVFNLTQ